jgi:signal transduction histidine kinase
MKLRHNIFTLSLFFGLLLYIIDAAMDSLILHTGTFWSSLFMGVPVHEIRERMVMVAGFLVFGIMVSRILAGRRRAEEALKSSEQGAQRMANETEIIAEIGRMITSTLNIEEVYEGFAEKVKMLLPFDRIVVHLNDLDAGIITVAYTSGLDIPERGANTTFTLEDSVNQIIMNTRASLLTQLESLEELEIQFPTLIPIFQAGVRSMISAPLIYRDQPIGALHFQSKKPQAYFDRDRNLAERITAQIAPAIANGQLFLEHKGAEETLAERTVQLERTNRELVALNAELDDFTNVASHDLQEPLRTLTAFSDMLRKDLNQSLPERAAQDLGFITDAARRMQTLIQDLLALSRASRVAKKREKVSLGECVDRALEALAIRMKETAAQVTRDELPEVWGDSTLLTQLYQNLIGNALKFCGDQPPLIRLTAEEQEGYPVFGVKDNGIGIESKYTQQIFQPFRRLHGRAEYEGSGIGLAICRKIVERHGGKIWVESEPGKGAHFLFTISHRRREG